MTPNFGVNAKKEVNKKEEKKKESTEDYGVQIEMDFSSAVLHDESEITATTANDILNE